MIKRILILMILTVSIYAKNTEKITVKKQYNIILVPIHIQTDDKKRKTRKAIQKGYNRSISELKRQYEIREFDLNTIKYQKEDKFTPYIKKPNLLLSDNLLKKEYLKLKDYLIEKKIDSIMGMVFYPIKIGRKKYIKIKIILVNIKHEDIKVTIKNIPEFQWHRSYLYISNKTGTIIREIATEILGEPFLFIKEKN